ncbi:MAG: HIT family protein [Rhodobacterales bacterium]|nr:HIT family protein [Rhodobacterales bacterium]
MPDPTCIFCKIVAGEIPAIRVHEDDRTIAFMDINPANPGHVLVVPRGHAPDLYAMPADDLAACALTAQRVARAVRRAVTPEGVNLVQANGPGAAQSVMHFHVHVLPRFQGDDLKLNWGLTPGDLEAISEMAEKIRDAMAASDAT